MVANLREAPTGHTVLIVVDPCHSIVLISMNNESGDTGIQRTGIQTAK
jgi:hypothetical protein